MEIKVLGSGCAKCDELERVATQAAADLGVEVRVEHVTDFNEIMSFGVMNTPALVVDGQVKVAGRVPTAEECAGYLRGASGSSAGGCCDTGGCCC